MAAPANKTVILSRACFGVTIPLDGGDPAATDLADAFDALNKSAEAAIDQARTAIRTDRAGRAAYNLTLASPLHPGPAAPAAPAAGSSGISLLDDCGLPLVNQSGAFLNNLQSELSSDTLHLVGFGSASNYGRDTVRPFWFTGPLSVLFPIRPNFGLLNSHYQLLSYLTRMNSSDDIWQDPRSQQWFAQFSDGLKQYMTDLFAGQFLDRNGTAVSFDLKAITTSLISLDTKQVAPQLAGGIITALVEFLGDQLFHVPVYSADALGAYRDYRKAKVTTGGSTDLATLTTAVEVGSISEADSKRLLNLSTVAAKQLLISGYPIGGPVPAAISGLAAGNPIPVSFDAVPSGGGNSPLIRSGVARLILAKIAQLDPTYATWAASAPIADQVTKLRAKFTAYRAGVIADNLQGLFDNRTGATSSADGDWGRPIDEGDPAKADFKVDYADLAGKLIAFGATSAEKSVRSLVGGLIRGVSIASLQNEVLAEVVASLAGGLSRKLVESVTYNTFQNYLAKASITPEVKWTSLKILATLLGLISK